MNIDIIGRTKDLRTNTFVLYALASIPDYLALVGNNLSEFEIQRKQEKHKAYPRMKKDIQEGAVLPPITLAIKPDKVENLIALINSNQDEEIKKEVGQPNQVYILDGLQRTYILKELQEEGKTFKEGQKLLLEFWIEKEIKHLIYRLIILNAGQKTMSLRHQLELLNMAIYDEIKKSNFDIQLNKEKDEQRRRSARVFSFEAVISSYYCFLTKNYAPNKENLITQQIQEEGVIYATESELDEKLSLFKAYLQAYTKLDECTYQHYNENNRKHFFAKENVMNAFFAATADYGNKNRDKQARIQVALDKLLNEFSISTNQDVLGLETYTRISTDSINPAKKNIGLATKEFLFDGFREFFTNEGDKSLADCWIFVAPQA